ncbi:MAG: FixH family protein [Actinomycetota bacterium]
MRRLALAAGAGLLAVAAWTSVFAPAASAHAVIEETEPANGELLDVSPEEVVLAFSEPPDLSLTTVGVVDETGADVPTGPVERVPGGDRTIRVRVDDLPDGVYTVTWRTVSTTDGHVTSDAFSFGVGVSAEDVPSVPPTSQEQTPPPTVASVAGRWALYAGLIVLFGAALAGLLAFGPRAVARPWILGSAWTFAAVGVVVMTLQERTTVDVSLRTLLESEVGAAFVRLGVAVAVAGVAVLVASIRTNTATLLLLAAAAGAAISVRATGGHAGGSVAQALLQTGHFAAAGAWIGGLVWLVVGLVRGVDAERVRRYSTIAAGGLGVLFVTGVLRSSNELGGLTWWLHAFDNGYGTTLLVKLAVVVPIVALGALNRYRHVRRFDELGSRPLLRTVGGELALAGGVLALTGVLTGLPPQAGGMARPPTGPEPLLVSGSDFATTTRVRLEISPGTVGPNTFVATITDYDTGEPVDARRVTLSFRLPDRPEVGSELLLEPGEDGNWRAEGTELSVAGDWEVDVTIESGAGSVEVPLEVTPIRSEPRVEVSRVEGQPDLYTFFFDGDVTIQAYVDPGVPGRTNQLHVTAFDPGGGELPLHHIVVRVTPPDGRGFEPELLSLSEGHVAANLDLEPGTYTFGIEALADPGELVGSFEQTFEG